MNQWPNTEPTLVERLADPRDDAAWNRFDTLYRPVVYRYARTRGLQHSDAETLVAEVMSRVFRAAGRWSKDSGKVLRRGRCGSRLGCVGSPRMRC